MMNTNSKQYNVNWSNHMVHVKKAFDNLLTNSEFTDVTLYTEGKKIGAHKVLLSACSTYFYELFKDVRQEQPIIVLKGVAFAVLIDILKFIYHGEVSVEAKSINAFLQAAEFLQIVGITTGTDKVATANSTEEINEESNGKTETEVTDTFTEKREEKRLSSDSEPSPDQSAKKKKKNAKADVKQEPPEVLTIFQEEIDPLQQESQVPSDLLLQATGSNYSGMTEEELKMPMADNFTRSGPYTVQDFQNYEFDSKQQDWNEFNYKCPECERIFKNRASYMQHRAVHMGNTECPICHQVLSRKYHLKSHMLAKHREQMNINMN